MGRKPAKFGVIVRPGADGHEFDDYQLAAIREFISVTLAEEVAPYPKGAAQATKAQRAYDAGWDASVELSQKTEELAATTDGKERRRLQKEINQKDEIITPAARSTAFEIKEQIRRGLFKYAQTYGGFTTKAHLINWLDVNGYTANPRAKHPGDVLSERRTYELINEVCGMQWRPGRKPG
jgi:hypothetical protein